MGQASKTTIGFLCNIRSYVIFLGPSNPTPCFGRLPPSFLSRFIGYSLTTNRTLLLSFVNFLLTDFLYGVDKNEGNSSGISWKNYHRCCGDRASVFQ